MNITAGLILLFLNIFLPGVLYLRFYYKGEYSKQFSTKIPLIQLAAHSAIPGFLIQVLGICVYRLMDNDFSLSGALRIYNDLLSTKSEFSENTVDFLDKDMLLYCGYTIGLLFFSAAVGFMLHNMVRYTRLDRKFKLLRFHNTWSYVFNGEISKFPKHESLFKNLEVNNKVDKVLFVIADVLIVEGEKTSLYSGYVADYDLESGGKNSLDRIYLLEPRRYKKKDNGHEVVPIPGSLFSIETKNLVNLNLTYVPKKTNRKHGIAKESSLRKKIKSSWTNSLPWAFLVVILLALNSVHFYLLPFLKFHWFANELNWFQMSLFSFTELLGILVLSMYWKPSDPKERRDNRNAFILLAAICLLITLYELIF